MLLIDCVMDTASILIVSDDANMIIPWELFRNMEITNIVNTTTSLAMIFIGSIVPIIQIINTGNNKIFYFYSYLTHHK